MYLVFTSFQILLLIFYGFSRERKLLYLVVSVLLVYAFYAFRIDVGEDWKHYKTIYEEGSVGRFELLFRVFVTFLRSISAPVSVFFGIIGLLQFYLLRNSLPETLKVHFIFFIIYFLSPSFLASANGMRQFLATSFVVYGFISINSLRKFVLFSVAILIHSSASLLIIMLYIFRLLPLNRLFMCCMLLLTTFVSIGFDDLASYIGYLAVLDNDRINLVLLNLEHYRSGGLSFGPRRSILLLIHLIICLVMSTKSRKNIAIISASIFFFSLDSLLINVNAVFRRIDFFWYALTPFASALSFYDSRHKLRQIFLYSLVVLVVLYNIAMIIAEISNPETTSLYLKP